MTNKEEVIEHLLLLKESAVKSHNDTGIINVKLDSFNFVMDMAIKALEQQSMPTMVYPQVEGITPVVVEPIPKEPPVNQQEPIGDLISRQDAIKAIEEKAKRIKNEDTLNGLSGAVAILFDLPSYNSIKTELSDDAVSRKVFEQVIWERDVAIAELKELGYRVGEKPPMGIWKVIEQEPKIVPIAEIKFDDDMLHEIVEEAVKNIEIEPKTGHWIAIDEEPHEDYECDKCGYVVSTYTANIEPHTEYKYCPNCGAKMVEEQESDHTCHTCHTCKHYTSGERDGSCGSYICKGYSNWESEDKE